MCIINDDQWMFICHIIRSKIVVCVVITRVAIPITITKQWCLLSRSLCIVTSKGLDIKIEDVHFNRRQWKKSHYTNILHRKPKTVIKNVSILWLQVIQHPPQPTQPNPDETIVKLNIIKCFSYSDVCNQQRQSQYSYLNTNFQALTSLPINLKNKQTYIHNIQLPVN